MNTSGQQPPLDALGNLVAKYQSDGQQLPGAPPLKKRDWKGFSEKTLWDWLNLIGVVLVPIMIGALTLVTTGQQNWIANDQ